MAAGPFPRVWRYGPNGVPDIEVPEKEWRKLKPFPMTGAPQPPTTEEASRLAAGALNVSNNAYGPKRAGVVMRTLEIESSKVFAPGLPPWGLLNDPPPSWTYKEVVTTAWSRSQLALAYREALKILRGIGLPIDADQVWCFRVSSGQWWALADRYGGTTVEQFETWPNLGRLFYRRSTPNMADAFPPYFAEELGGGGALEWAWWVVGAVRELRDGVRSARGRVRLIRDLTSLPEWAALEQAVKARKDPALDSALWQIREATKTDMPSEIQHAFTYGFELGQGLGFHSVVDSVRRHDRDRPSSKDDLNRKLREWIAAKAAAGAYVPNAHAIEIWSDPTAMAALKALGLRLDTAKSLGEKLRLLALKS